MRLLQNLSVIFILFFVLLIPSLLSADCDMMALIGLQNTILGNIQNGDGAFDDPHDLFNFLRSRSGPADGDIPLNCDGYGIIYYRLGSSILADEQEFFKVGYGNWYIPDNNDPLDLAETAIMDTVNEAEIVLGHVRFGTGGNGNHPFTLKWNGITYSFMHNGTVPSYVSSAFMNYLGEGWFNDHPSNWYGVYGDYRTFIDSELLFHFIMSKVIAHDGNIVQGLIEALNSNDVLGVNFRSVVFNTTSIVNFVLTDGNSLYVFRNSPYDENLHNLSYNIMNDRFICIKTQDRLDNLIEKDQLVVFDQAGNITTTTLDATLPVELSSFNGSVALDGIVTMNWSTASETGMSGFNLYRGNTNTFTNAIKLNTQLINATNNANGSTYQFVDDETSPGLVYHYWLECIDTNGAVSHVATVTVTIPNYNDPGVPPVYTTYMLPNYPNPFKSGNVTNIPVHVKAGDAGTLTIYNIKGQKITAFSLVSGNSLLSWDGHDSKGKLCAPGIYLSNLKTKNQHSTRKLLMVR